MKYLLTGVAAIAMLTACGDKNKTVDSDAGGSVEFAADAVPGYKLRKGDPATASQALAALSLDSASSGRISFADSNLNGDKAVFTNVTLAAADDADDEDDDAHDNGLHLEGADLTAAKLEFDGLAMVDGKANFSRMLMSDLVFVPTDPEDADNGSATIKSVELVNPSPEMAAWVASLFTDSEPADMPEGAALSFDHWAMNGLDFKVDDPEGEKGTFTINTIAVTGMQDRKAAQMLLQNMSFDFYDAEDDTNVKASIGDFDIRGLDLKVFAPEGEEEDDLGEAFGAGFMSGLQAHDPANPGYDSINISNLDFDVSGVSFVMPKLASNVGRDKQGRAVKVVTDPYKMTLSAGEGELGEELGAQLATLGYESIELSGAGEQNYNPDTDVVTLAKDKNYFELKDGFRLDFAAKYEGAKAMAEAAQAESAGGTEDAAGDAMQAALGALSIHSFELSFADDGFVDRAFNAYAAQSGEDPQQLRNQVAGLLAMAPMMAAGSGVDMELATEVTAALSSFITDPKTLTLSLNPEAPLKMSELAEMEDPSALTKASLGFAASNK